jgi:hypothetical protein
MMDVIRKGPSCHVRLEHFPLSLAEALWERLKDEPLWK